MNKSESIKNLSVALCKAQGMLEHAKKGVENTFFKSKYADLASVIDAAKYPLSNNGLSVSQIVDTDENSNITLETILMHESGEWICGRYPIRPVKTDPQSMGSAITYARRYAFSAITGIAADDDDGNAASQIGVPNREKPLIPTEKQVITPDTPKSWENAKKAYLRDGNLNAVLKKAVMSVDDQALLIQECTNAVS